MNTVTTRQQQLITEIETKRNIHFEGNTNRTARRFITRYIDRENRITPKQRATISNIERNCNIIFEGGTKQEAYTFIANNLEHSKIFRNEQTAHTLATIEADIIHELNNGANYDDYAGHLFEDFDTSFDDF